VATLPRAIFPQQTSLSLTLASAYGRDPHFRICGLGVDIGECTPRTHSKSLNVAFARRTGVPLVPSTPSGRRSCGDDPRVDLSVSCLSPSLHDLTQAFYDHAAFDEPPHEFDLQDSSSHPSHTSYADAIQTTQLGDGCIPNQDW